MEIKLLGTGSAEGWPGLFCACEVCQRSRKIGGKNLRTRSSALIDGALKIDFPSDTLHHVIVHGLDLTQVRYLLFTHAHDDHFAVRELQYLSWMFVPYAITTPLRVLAPFHTAARIRESLELEGLPLDLRCIEPWETICLERWRVTGIVAQHDPKQVCLNYLISDGNRTLLYASDTGWYEPPTWRFLAGMRIDAAVIECTKGPVEGGYMAHLCIPEVIRMRERLVQEGVLRSDGRVVTTHHSHLGGLLHDELEAALNPHGIEVGYDGMTFEI